MNTPDKNLSLAIAAMAAATFASNYLVEFPINAWLTWGAFTYPLTFLVTELTNFHKGPKAARRVVYIGFFVAIMINFLWTNPRIAAASCTAFLIGQLLDISVFNSLRQQVWWIAPFAASALASFIDTALFFSLAFAGENFPWITIAIGDFGIKLCIDVLLLLPFRLMLWRRIPLPFAKL